MDSAFVSSSRAVVAVATALLLALCCGAGRYAAAARPLGPQEAAAFSEAAMPAFALPPDGAGHRRAAAPGYDDAAARAGKWLPLAGAGAGVAHHLPAAFWAHRQMPWVGVGVAGAGAGHELGSGGGGALDGGEEELVRDRERERSYEGGESETTTSRQRQQEQLAMWASLLNPKGKRRPPATRWLPAPGIGEAVDEEPVKAAADGAAGGVEGAEVEDPAAGGGVQVGQAKSGFYWGNGGN
ncbi:hypothetical protein EJB05_52268, partial [Eragrostis curvula]